MKANEQGEEWDTRSYVLPRGETDTWGRSRLLDTLHCYKAMLLLACPSPHFPFQMIPNHLPFLDGARERSTRTFSPQELGPDDHGNPTHLHGPEVPPTAGLKGKPPLTDDSALHVAWALGAAVHHVHVFQQQRHTAALLPMGLGDTAGRQTEKHLRGTRDQGAAAEASHSSSKAPLNQREQFSPKTYMKPVASFYIIWNCAT